MLESQYVFKGTVVYSPWMSRGGDNWRIGVDVVGIAGTSPVLTVHAFHKNSEDPGNGAAIGTSLSATGVGRHWQEYSGLKEMVRYKFVFGATGGTDARALFRMLPPVWFDAVQA